MPRRRPRPCARRRSTSTSSVARLFTRDGTLLASYDAARRTPATTIAHQTGDGRIRGRWPVFEGDRLRVVRPIALNHESSAASRSSRTRPRSRPWSTRFGVIVAGTLFGRVLDRAGAVAHDRAAHLRPDRPAHRGDPAGPRRRPLRRPGRGRRRRRDRRADRPASTRCCPTSRSAISSCSGSRTTSSTRSTRAPPNCRPATRSW